MDGLHVKLCGFFQLTAFPWLMILQNKYLERQEESGLFDGV